MLWSYVIVLMFLFCSSNDELAKNLIQEYGADSTKLPTAVMVNHATRAVHVFNQGALTKSALTDWIKSALGGQSPTSKCPCDVSQPPVSALVTSVTHQQVPM